MSKRQDQKRDFEATRDFYLRRNYRAIRKAAAKVDPNSGFRLSTKSLAAGGVAAAIARLDAERKAEAARIASIPARDRRMAAKEAGATRLPGKVYGH